MQVELRNIKFAAFASEETPCYKATLYLDGIKSGTVANDGHGGPDYFSDHKAEAKLEAYAKTLPAIVTDMKDPKDPTKPFTYAQSAEHLVGEVLNQHLKAKDLQREKNKLAKDLTCRLIYTKPGQKAIFQTKKVTPQQLAHWLADGSKARSTIGADKILNMLPAEEAWKVYDANIQRTYR